MARVRNVPRDTRYCPSVDKDTIPFGWTIKNLDVRRTTITNGQENADGKRGYDMDYWCGLKELDEETALQGMARRYIVSFRQAGSTSRILLV